MDFTLAKYRTSSCAPCSLNSTPASLKSKNQVRLRIINSTLFSIISYSKLKNRKKMFKSRYYKVLGLLRVLAKLKISWAYFEQLLKGLFRLSCSFNLKGFHCLVHCVFDPHHSKALDRLIVKI